MSYLTALIQWSVSFVSLQGKTSYNTKYKQIQTYCSDQPILSTSFGYTRGKKKHKHFPFSHYQTLSPLSVSVQGKTGHCHTFMPQHGICAREAKSYIQRPVPTPPPPKVNSNLHSWNPYPLVQTHLRVPRQCHLIDSACVEGLGVVYAECQASASQLSVSVQVAEWVASDVGGWMRVVEVSRGEGCQGKVLPQESQKLIWPAGSGCL